MTEPTQRKGYFNALASANFKTGADGRQLFFPWGAMSTGYVIPTPERHRQLRRQIKIYAIVSLVLVIAASVTMPFYISFGIAILLATAYSAWTPRLVRGLQLSAERMSTRESMAIQARTHHKATLWLMEIASLAFVAIGVAMLILDPRNWMMALASIAFFGFCAAVFVRMLVLRRDNGSTQRSVPR